MGEINIPRSEQDALRTIDTNMLSKLIEQCLLEESPHALQMIRLESCGAYVAAQLQYYERALAEYRKARAAKKRDESRNNAHRAGHDLIYAVQQMQNRLEVEEKEAQLFWIEEALLH
ncbi:hypothetical protein QR66_18995, partial [Chromobacterium piscinae]